MAVDERVPRVIPEETDAAKALARAEAPRLGLSPLDKIAIGALIDGPKADLYELVRASAEALSGPDADGSRARLLARQTAICAATVSTLSGILGEKAQAGDERGALLADRLLTGAVKRLAILCSTSATAGRPTVVAINHVGSVHIGEE